MVLPVVVGAEEISETSPAFDLARRLAELGPRPAAGARSVEAAELLRSRMIAAGLEDVQSIPAGASGAYLNLTGVLPGESGLEVVLGAHYDTVAASPGAADNAAGCAVVLAAAAGLADLPRRHTLRVVLFDGEEEGLAGSAAWSASLDDDQRRSILAMINVDLVGWNPSSSGVARLALSGGGARLRLPSAWLVHAVVRGAAVIGEPIGVATSRWAPIGQLHARAFQPIHRTDADPVALSGVPALTLTEADPFSRYPERHTERDTAARLDALATERWVGRLTAVVRRLDVLAGRPRDDDQYLAVATRVLSRRDLYWINLVVWIALVFLGLPGRWRGERSSVRSRRGRSYLPGFTQRLLYLAAILMLPVFSTLLLLPAALVSAVRSRTGLPSRVGLAIALLPLALLVVALGYLAFVGRLGAPALGLPAVLLLAASLGSMLWSIEGRS